MGLEVVHCFLQPRGTAAAEEHVGIGMQHIVVSRFGQTEGEQWRGQARRGGAGVVEKFQRLGPLLRVVGEASLTKGLLDGGRRFGSGSRSRRGVPSSISSCWSA